MYTGLWTPKNEEWFLHRLQDMKDGRVSPMNVQRWRSSLGQHRKCAKLADVVDELSTLHLDIR